MMEYFSQMYPIEIGFWGLMLYGLVLHAILLFQDYLANKRLMKKYGMEHLTVYSENLNAVLEALKGNQNPEYQEETEFFISDITFRRKPLRERLKHIFGKGD